MTDMDKYTRVTDALYPLSGLNKIDPVVLKNAADRGTRVHEVCAVLMDNLGLLELDESISGYIKSYEGWANGKKFIRPPRFFCDEHMITGECDALYQDNGEWVLVDLKTPLNESKTWMLQGSAYSYLAKKTGYDIKRIEFVKLSKVGKPAKVYVYEEKFDLYLKCLEVYRYFFKAVIDENPMDYM